MSNNKDDDKLNSDFSLEEILAEFGSGPKPAGPDLPWPEAARKEPPRNVVPFPSAPPAAEDGGEEEEAEPEAPEEEEAAPEEEAPPPPPPRPKAVPTGEKVLAFPEEEPESPLRSGLEHLKRKTDAFADKMFEAEGVEVSEETMRFEKLIPGVDEEEAPSPPPTRERERKPRREAPPPPDLAPAELAARYGRGLPFLRLRAVLVALLALPQLFLALAPFFGVPLPGALGASLQLQGWVAGGLLVIAAVLGADVLARGFVQLFVLRPGADTLAVFACLLTLADAFTFTGLTPDRDTLPYCAAATLSIFCALWGTYAKRQGLRLSCRTAAAASTPYLVTLDERAWNGKDTYAKFSGPIHGFGSQVQEDDGAQRVYRAAAPLLLLACTMASLIASVAQGKPEHLVWCLSATLTASASLSGMLVFARPFRTLARRLSSSGAALPGWSGAGRPGAAILLNDADLFPPGTVSLNGIKIFGDFSVEKVVGVCATLIKESGSGLDKIFHDLLRSQGAVYRRCSGFQRHEAGGLSADVRGEHVLVGSASFMALMEVSLPQGLNVRNAVFCAIDGELAGIFALNYVMHAAIPPALSALIGAKVSPVLCTRDFNLIPAMLRQKFKLPVEKMDFPPVERRAQLSDTDAPHSDRIAAVLCREGLGPYSEAVVGAKRLRAAVLWSTALSVAGSVVGLLLSFYLTFVSAYWAISPAHLTIFLCAWTVPTFLISGWVNRF